MDIPWVGMNNVVIVAFVPRTHADAVRVALAAAGAGSIGEYTACSFTAMGEGRFTPGTRAHPTIGEPLRAEVVDEVRIEAVCHKSRARAAVEAMLAAHPYEEPAWHVYEAATCVDELPG